jgi:hypothetical protein
MLSALPEKDKLETANASSAPSKMSAYFTDYHRLWYRKYRARDKI